MTYSDPWHMFMIYWPAQWSYGSLTSILQCNANLYCIFSWGTEKLNILFKIMKPGSHKTVNIFNSDPSDSKAHDPNHFNTLKLWHVIPIFFMLLCNCLCIFSVVPHFSLSIFPTIVQGSYKRALDALELEFQEVVSCLIRCWPSDSCPLEKQHALLTIKPSFQPQVLEWLSLIHFPVFFFQCLCGFSIILWLFLLY